MSEFQYDPESLADRLDALLDRDATLPVVGEDPLIETALRLANAPHPTLREAVVAQIQAEMLKANWQAARPPLQRVASIAGISILVGAMVIVAVYFGVLRETGTEETATPSLVVTATVPPTRTVTPESTITATAEVVGSVAPTVSETPTVSPSPGTTLTVSTTATTSPTVTATVTASVTPGATDFVLPTLEATPTISPLVMVIEGPVEYITGNMITVYAIPVQLASNDPLLSTLHVGDMVRITGEAVSLDVMLVVTVATVTLADPDIYVNPATGEVFRDDSDCSNPPPPWAPAVGWRERCEGTRPGNNPPGGGNQGMGQGSGNNDD